MQRPRLANPLARLCLLSIMALPSAMAAAQETSSAIAWPVVRMQGTEPNGAPATPAEAATEPAKTEPGKSEPGKVDTTVSPSAPASPILAAIRARLSDAAAGANQNKDDFAALSEFYSGGSAKPLWVADEGLNAKATAVLKSFDSAADWGLEQSSFDKPSQSTTAATPEALAQAEVTLSLSALKYARFARGGRLNPSSLSRILDMRPPVKDPKTVIAELSSSETPDQYLRDQHPKHEQFERLRQALLKSRGPAEPAETIDEALKIRLPNGKVLKKGMEGEDVALLRRRLKRPAEAGAKETVFDEPLLEAVTAYQVSQGLAPSGNLTNATRAALNAEGAPKKSNPKQNEQRLIINMEKWRWMPENLGSFYVWDNVPEFQTRAIKDNKVVFQEKIIVGMPEWATPTFSADMEFIIFYPSWGVPDGIKQRELLPRLKKAGGGGFFDQLFGGGGGGSSVLKAYGLTAYRNGKVVDPDSIDWSSTDIRSFSFNQPSGGQNPLGIVKFRFPNPHDVYMHDTTQKNLFGQSFRALSHGCIRVQNPIRFAEVLLNEDRGWSPDRVRQSMGQGDITLNKKIPVHITYFTAVADDAGKVSTFGDLYGHDSRISSALGRAMEFDGGNAVVTASIASDATDVIPGAGDSGTAPVAAPSADSKKPKKDKYGKQAKKKSYAPADGLSDAVSGLLNN
ncbi:MAG: L,D-transpeptidase family protein [Hyphomicrobium sp.]